MTSWLPLAVFLVLVGGVSLLFVLDAPTDEPRRQEEVSVPEATPFDALGPSLRGLAAEGGEESEILVRAVALVERVLAQWGSREIVYEPGGPALRQAIVQALRSGDWGVMWAGALAVPRFGPAREGLARALVEVLGRSTQVRVREAVLRALAFVGAGYEEIALGPLLEAAGTGALVERRAALGTLARRPALVVPLAPALFVEALDEDDTLMRTLAAQALAGLELAECLPGSVADRVGPRLAQALGDASGDVRMYAAMALGRLGPRAASQIPALVEALRDESTLVRDQAASALGQVGVQALPALAKALEDPEGARPSTVAWALRLQGAAAVPLLQKALLATRAEVRLHAALALLEARQDASGAVEVLCALLEDGEADTRLLAARGLGRAGAAGRVAIGLLRERAQDPDEGVRQAVQAALRTLGSLEGR